MPINITTTLGTNTGKSPGDARYGRLKILLLTRGKEFTKEDLADSDTLKEAIQEAMNEGRISINKIFPFSDFQVVTDNTGDPTLANLGPAYEEVTNEAAPKYIIEHVLGVGQTQSFSDFNGWQDKAYFI